MARSHFLSQSRRFRTVPGRIETEQFDAQVSGGLSEDTQRKLG